MLAYFLDQPCFNFSAGVNHDLTQTNTQYWEELSDEIRVHSWFKSGKESSSSRDATVQAGLARCGESSAPRSMLSSVGEAE